MKTTPIPDEYFHHVLAMSPDVGAWNEFCMWMIPRSQERAVKMGRRVLGRQDRCRYFRQRNWEWTRPFNYTDRFGNKVELHWRFLCSKRGHSFEVQV